MQERSVVFYAPNQILSVSKVRLIELWRLSDENFKIFKFSYDYCVRLNNQISTDYKFPSLPAPAPAWTVEFSNCGINVHLQFTMFRKSPNCLQPLNSPTGPLSIKIFANNHANIRWQCKKACINREGPIRPSRHLLQIHNRRTLLNSGHILYRRGYLQQNRKANGSSHSA